MAENAFLDKSIILGYIFLSDPHHLVCREYFDSGDKDYYTTQEVENVYHRRKEEIVEKHQIAVSRHVQLVTREFEGELTKEDIEDIRGLIDRSSNPAWRFLEDFYTGKEGESVYVVTKDLRLLMRDLEQRADTRQSKLYGILHGWVRFETYPELQNKLQMLVERGEEEDLRMILDAHDVASNVEGPTELTTANPKDFDDPDVKAVIDDHTNIHHVELIFVSRDYDPS